MALRGWEGWGNPVMFKNSAGKMTLGAIADNISNLKDFANYTSNGTSWVSVSTLQRIVHSPTRAYYASGALLYDLPIGSYVWLTQNCTRGQKNSNYVAVTAVQPKDRDKITFKGNGFVDLTYDNHWLNVSSILLRKVYSLCGHLIGFQKHLLDAHILLNLIRTLFKSGGFKESNPPPHTSIY